LGAQVVVVVHLQVQQLMAPMLNMVVAVVEVEVASHHFMEGVAAQYMEAAEEVLVVRG